LNTAYQASRHLEDSLTTTGEEAFTTSGRLRNAAAALLNLDVVGAAQAFERQPKNLEELGISAVEASNRMGALQAVANGTAKEIAKQASATTDGRAAWKSYNAIVDEAGTANRELAQELINQVAALQAADNAQNALADSTARLGQAFRTAAGDAVTFKGAADDVGGLRGPGLVDQINAELEVARRGKIFGSGAAFTPIGPAAKNAAAQSIAQAQDDLPEVLRLQKQERERLQKALENSTGNVKQRTALNAQLAQASASVIGTQKAIESNAKAAAAAAAAARDAAARARAQQIQKHFAAILASLRIGVDKAALDKNLNNDVSALVALKLGLERQVKAGVDVQSAQAQLVQVAGQIQAKQQEIRAKAAEALQADQFKALGLDAQGAKLPPTIENLKKQISQLSSRDELSSNQQGLLNRIRKVLVDPLKKATPETRSAAKALIDGVRDEINKGVEKLDAQKFKRIQISDKILAALGLGKEPSVASFAAQAAVGSPKLQAPSAGQTVAAPGGVTISGPITVVADNPDVFLRELQKKAGRTSATASGRHAGRSLGLG
jgi:hypothetical protein